MTHIKVALLPSDAGGCGFYRLLQPFGILQLAGSVECIVRRIKSTGQFCLSPEDIEAADVIVIQRQGGKTKGMPFDHLLKSHGHKTVYEIDDDIGSLTKDNPAYQEHWVDDPKWWCRATNLMRMCSMVVTTTPFLAGRMSQYNKQTRVAVNGVDMNLWRPEGWTRRKVEAGGNIRVGYIASRHHVDDARLLIKPWKAIAREFHHVTFVLAGAFYPCLKEALGDRVEFHDGVPIDQYPAWCRSLSLDVAVAPLVDSRFARSKSPLKWIESTALGIPMVASDVDPYRVDGGPMLAENTDVFTHHLRELCHPTTGAFARTDQWSRAETYVQARYLAQHSADQWLSIVQEVAQWRTSGSAGALSAKATA
jgi:glycosyltransferase involved in cell wall biosynthesis